jgi:hypothetical protein
MNRNPRQLFTLPVLLGAFGFACLLTMVTLAFIGLTASPRGTDPGFVPANLTVIAAPTSTPAFTPTATFDPLIGTATLPAGEIAIGAYVQITGTQGDGLRLRSGPGLSTTQLFLGGEAEVFQVKDGPKEADGYIWWYLVAPYDESRSGWAAANFLSVVPPPQ